jgi:co-chaperonin GroES (HSP10)
MHLKHYGLQAVILPDTPPDKINGIHIPEEARKPANTGVIISISPDSGLKDGDHVFYNHRTGYIAEYGDKKYLSINHNFILGTIKDNIMQPLHARVLVEPIIKNETLSEGGVVLLEDKTIAEGKVIATGSGTQSEPMLLEVGDVIIYPKNLGVKVGDNIILNQGEVYAVTERQMMESGND